MIKVRTCSVEGCENTRVAWGWCDKHYRRWKRYGDPLGVAVRSTRTCSIEGCDNPHEARGWCSKHYQRWQVHGDPEMSLVDLNSYGAVHARIRRLRGPARAHRCYYCGDPAAEWSYDHADAEELIGLNEGRYIRYSTDLERYVPACRTCHRRIDRWRVPYCRFGHPQTLANRIRVLRSDRSSGSANGCRVCQREYSRAQSA